MTISRKIFVSLSIFFCLNIYGQTKPTNVEDLSKTYSDYFALDRESVFLHLNKTTLVPTEDIWFSAYIYQTKSMLPNLETTNLHVNLYDPDGKLMDAKTVFINNGHGAGYFALDSLHVPGTYLIKASTKYMDNFREDLSFSQTFTILGENTAPEMERAYDLQLLPEGGHLVAEVANTVGIKLIDNSGQGVFFTDGKVLNEKQETISTFSSNQFGLAKFRIVPHGGKEYYVALTTESGKEIKKKIPVPETRGIVISANSMVPGSTVFSIRTNIKTRQELNNDPFFMAIHNAGQEIKVLQFQFPENKMEATLKITDKTLYPGVNIITIFDQHFQPLLERLIFKREGVQRKQILGDYKKRKRDSLIIGLRSSDSLGLHSMSVSVLPAGTEAYRPNNTIFSAFYLEPYTKGNLENGGYYFSEKTKPRRRNYDMDLLLLTQGWSKYSWQNIFNNTPKEFFQAEHGFSILGKIPDLEKEKENKVFLKSKENDLFAVLKLSKDGSFELKNMILKDSTTLHFGLIHEKNDNISKPPIYLRILPAKTYENMEVPTYGNIRIKAGDQPVTEIASFLKNTTILDSIILKAKTQERKITRTSLGGEKTTIDEQLANLYFYVTELIRAKGFRVRRNASTVSISSTRGPTLRGPAKPLVFLDDMALSEDNSALFFLQTKDVESITVNKIASAYGMRTNGAGVIRIRRKNGVYASGPVRETVSATLTSNGFAENKEFYAPKYTSYSSSMFERFGTIAWLPSVVLDENGKTTIKILNTLQPKINLYIEGITATGALISEIITVETR